MKNKVFARDGWKCYSCKGTFYNTPEIMAARQTGGNVYEAGNYLTVDHIVPVSAGGTNGLYNLVSMCYMCNQDKADGIEAHPEYYEIIFTIARLKAEDARNKERARKRKALRAAKSVLHEAGVTV